MYDNHIEKKPINAGLTGNPIQLFYNHLLLFSGGGIGRPSYFYIIPGEIISDLPIDVILFKDIANEYMEKDTVIPGFGKHQACIYAARTAIEVLRTNPKTILMLATNAMTKRAFQMYEDVAQSFLNKESR